MRRLQARSSELAGIRTSNPRVRIAPRVNRRDSSVLEWRLPDLTAEHPNQSELRKIERDSLRDQSFATISARYCFCRNERGGNAGRGDAQNEFLIIFLVSARGERIGGATQAAHEACVTPQSLSSLILLDNSPFHFMP